VYQAFGASSTDARFFADNAYGGAGMFSNHPFLFYTNSAERMRITSAGLVGIGVTPANQFEVKTANDAILRVNNLGATQSSQIQSTNLARSAFAPLQIGGSFTVLETNGSERMRIHASGGVSIGNTTDPGASNLSVTGTGTFGGAVSFNGGINSAPLIRKQNTTGEGGEITLEKSDTSTLSGTGVNFDLVGNSLRFFENGGTTRGVALDISAQTAGAASLIITSSSTTGINASALSAGTVPTARLASGTANASTYLRGDQTWATVSGGITLTNDTTTNASYYVTLTTATSGSISAANVSSTKLFFNPSTGTLTATVMSANSDERLKENWTDVTSNFISKLAQVKHGVFSRKDSGNREPGVSAQSFMAVLPEAVVEGADGYLSVNYGGAALVAAIELAKVVEDLRAEIESLKGK
jgi:hypothetical protein